MFDIGDCSIARAIDTLTRATLIRGEPQHRVIENVERIHTELQFYAFVKSEVLQDRSIGIEDARAAIAEDAHVPDVPNPGVGERTAAGYVQDVGDRREEGHLMGDWIKRSSASME